MPDTPHPDADIPAGPPIDITNPGIFAFLSCVCLAMGSILGMICAWLFYEVSHPRLFNGMRVNVIDIAPIHGALMIIILALTGLMIALTFHYVPRWVLEYHEQGKIPPWMIMMYHKLVRFAKLVRGKPGELE